MQKINKTLFIIASVMVVIFIATNKIEAQIDGDKFFNCLTKAQNFRDGNIKIVSAKLGKKKDFTYPQISKPKTKNERKFNSDVLKIVKRDLAGDGNWTGYGFSASYATSEFVSVKLWVQFCGASCHIGITPVNFDLKTGKHIDNLSELFKPKSNYLKTIASYAIGEFRRCKWGEEEDDFKEGTKPIASNYKIWSLSQNGIEITFPEYQIGPGAIPDINIMVPYSNLSKILRTDVDWFSLPQKN